MLLLLFLAATAAHSQSSECVIPVIDSRGTPVLLGLDELKLLTADGTGSIIITEGKNKKVVVQESIDSVISLSGGNFFKFTDAKDGAVKAVAKQYVTQILQNGPNATILVKNISSAFNTNEAYAVIKARAIQCAGGGGGGGGGLLYSGANLGTGSGVYITTDVDVHQFRSMAAGGGMAVNTSGNNIVFATNLSIGAALTGTGHAGTPLNVADNGITTAKILNANVTYAKIQNVAAQRLLGNSTGAPGPVQEISLGTGLAWSGTSIVATGGGGGGGDEIYDAGNGCWVRASDVGVTFAKAGGTGTITVPEGVTLRYFRISGATADLNVSNQFLVVINHTGVGYNSNVATMVPPLINVVNTAAQLGGGPTTDLPFIYDEGSSPQVQLTAVAAGDCTVRVINLNEFSNWYIIGSL